MRLAVLVAAQAAGLVAIVFAAERGLLPSSVKSVIADVHGVLLGGQYRVTIRCPMADNRVSYFMRSNSEAEARETLRWTLPVCELRWLTVHAPPGAEPASWPLQWYRGDFFCPSNFHHRRVSVIASDIDAAVADVRASARECRVEMADQTDCALLKPACRRSATDFRATAIELPGRAVR